MSKTEMARVWTVIGTALAFYTFNTVLKMMSVNTIFEATLLHHRRDAAAYFGVAVGSVLLIGVVWLANLHLRKFGGRHWHERMPVVAFKRLRTGSREGMVYQAVFLAGFVVVPAVSLVWFAGIVAAVGLCDRDTKEWLSVVAPRFTNRNRYALGDCDHGVRFLPPVEAAWLGGLAMAAIGYAIVYLIRLFGRKSS